MSDMTNAELVRDELGLEDDDPQWCELKRAFE
jgi:hypothetical protein